MVGPFNWGEAQQQGRAGRTGWRGGSADRALSANLGLRACAMCVFLGGTDNVLQLLGQLVIQLKFVKIV